MNLNQKAIGQRFANLNQEKGMAEIIESKSLLNQVRVADDERLPMAQEKILFATIAKDSELAAPEMKLLSMLGHLESKFWDKHSSGKENKRFHEKMDI